MHVLYIVFGGYRDTLLTTSLNLPVESTHLDFAALTRNQLLARSHEYAVIEHYEQTNVVLRFCDMRQTCRTHLG
jgi:hypothetical protein